MANKYASSDEEEDDDKYEKLPELQLQLESIEWAPTSMIISKW